jgi:hypothetical protein
MTVKKTIKRKNKPGGGRPFKSDAERKTHGGLTNEQMKQVKGLADERNVSTNAVIRQAVQWYLDALDGAKQLPVINRELETAEVITE